jgi:uronate dehydrogenase
VKRAAEIVLVTGAAGRVARAIMPALRQAFRLRLLDTDSVDTEGDDAVLRCDVRDLAALTDACRGARAIVHLAAEPDEADFRTLLLPKNLDGTWAAFEAAAQAGVPRFIFASSIQTVDGYPPETFVSVEMPPRPVSVYGCTKVFGEAVGRLYADTRDLGVACLRIGAVTSADNPRLATDERFRSLWCEPSDLARLVIAAVRSDASFATVHAVSPPGTSRFDTSNPFGWLPKGEPGVGAQ